MFDTIPAHLAALIGFLAGAFALGLLTLVVGMRLLRQRHREGFESRQAEIDALGDHNAELHQQLDTREQDLLRERQRSARYEQQLQLTMREHGELRGRLARLELTDQALTRRERELDELRERHSTALAQISTLETRLADEMRAATEKLDFLGRVRQEFGDSFKVLAGEVLHERSQALVADNSAQIGSLLNPVREQLKTFQDAVQQAYVQEARERSLLAREIDALKTLNQQLSSEALNLTRALRGDTRVQGAWGELILSRILEASGLVEGREYTTQAVLRDEDGSRPRPDVIVHLPQERDLVIDAKVSLTAYERSVNADTELDRAAALAEHLGSLRRHVDGLSRRDYAALLDGRALDFVLLFVPVESALIEAVRADPGLYEYALSRNIAIVSPSTLLATLRAASHLWKQEQRNRNAQEIAQRAGKLYDKFVGFIGDLDSVRLALSKAQSELDQAYAKLSAGKGNLVRQTEQLRELGARHQKSLPADLVSEAGDE
ncbi:MAG: DNA recombination protein RmuC [Lysobacterales bacterium]